MRFGALLPIVFSLVAFVLAMLAVFAGNKPGFMEDYHIIMLNTSNLGHNLIPTPTSGGNAPTTTSGGSGIGGFFSDLAASATAALGAAESELAKLGDHVADELARELGIKQFYSLHVQDVCEGDFSPNATTPGAGYNVTNCTEPLRTAQFNISARLDHELSVGPIHLNLADLKWSQDLQNEFDKIPSLLLALAIFFMLGAGFTGLSLIASVLGFFTSSRHPRTSVFVCGSLALLAALTLLIGDLITTIGGHTAVNEINDHGNDIGLSASTGWKFLAITWSAFGLMAIAAGYWIYAMFAANKERRGVRRRHTKERYSADSHRP